MGLGIDKIWQMIGNQKESNKPTYAKARVLRKDNDGVIWVSIEGGVDETPTYSTTANVKPNDVVTVKVAGGKVYIEGSTSSPSVGVTEFDDAVTIVNKNVKKVDEKADKAAEDSEAALAAAKAAEEATDVARVTGQHFWVNDDEPETYGGTGAHVTEQEKDDWVESIRRRFPDISDNKPYHNILMNSFGILLRTALNNLVSITRSSISFFDGLGNNASNVVASFGKNGAAIGSNTTANILIDQTHVLGTSSEGMKYLNMTIEGERESRNCNAEETACQSGSTVTLTMDEELWGFGNWPPPIGQNIDVMAVYVRDGIAMMAVSTITYGTAKFGSLESDGVEVGTFQYDGDSELIVNAIINCTIDMGYTSHALTPQFVFGSGISKEPYAVSEGQGTVASGYASHAEGSKTIAQRYAHSEGLDTKANGDASHAEGYGSTVSSTADYSHVEGQGTKASFGLAAHAEGRNTDAHGIYSHAEGEDTVANGTNSHAEGLGTVASGVASHSQNRKTIAASDYQTAIGKWNVEDANGINALIIGNGTADDVRSNAFTVDWDGNIDFSGKMSVSKLSWAGTTDNLVATATDNNQEWSIDLVPNGHTGTYWHVWTAAKSTILRCDVDTGRVTMPYEVYSNSRYNVKMGGIQRGVKPSAIAFGNYEFKDKDEKRLGIVEFACGTDGTNDLHLYVLGNIASGDYYSGIIIRKTFENTACANMVYNANDGWLEVPGVVRVAGLTQYKNSGIEFYPPANNSGYGGIIDFHFNQSTADYTSRIWENAQNRLTMESNSLYLRSIGASAVYTIQNKGVNAAASNNGISATQYPGFTFNDASDRILSRMECVLKTDGSKEAFWYVRQYNTSGTNTAQKGIHIKIPWGQTAATYQVDDPANFRSAIGAQAAGNYAPHGWTQKATNTNDNAMTYSLSGCTEVMFAAMAGTTYLGSVILPVSLLHASTYREVYLSGGRTSTGGRAFALKATTTRSTVATRIQDTGAVACTWWVFAR